MQKHPSSGVSRIFASFGFFLFFLGSLFFFPLASSALASGSFDRTSCPSDLTSFAASPSLSSWASPSSTSLSSSCFFSFGNSEPSNAFFITFFLPPLGLVFNLVFLVQGNKEQRHYWGLWNAIVFGMLAAISGGLLLAFPLASVEFFALLGVGLGALPFMILGIVNVSIAAGMHRVPRRRSEAPEAPPAFAQHESPTAFLPLLQGSF